MTTLLKKARYNVNIVDGRGGVRLIPKEDKQEIESPELVELKEQLKIEFKKYNELVYQPIMSNMTCLHYDDKLYNISRLLGSRAPSYNVTSLVM